MKVKKKIAAPKLARAPLMSRTAAALRLRNINENHVQRQQTHNDRLLLAKSVAEKTARTNHEIEYNALLGASLHGHLSGDAIDKLAKQLLAPLAISLDMPASTFENAFWESQFSFRLSH